MLRSLFFLCLYSLLPIALSAQVIIPYGQSITVDGNLSTNEWAQSDTITINSGNGKQVQVLYQYSAGALHLAFAGHLESQNIRFPEVLIDTDHDQNTNWQNDDWWFHVSATDCEYQGQYGNYDSCATIRPNWTGHPNFSSGPPVIDTVEISIPFTTLDIDYKTDTIGMSFLVTNTFSAWEHWPVNATRQNPSSWQAAYFSPNSIELPEKMPDEIKLYPNPSRDFITIESESEIDHFRLWNASGERVMYNSNLLSDSKVLLDLRFLNNGIYLLEIRYSNDLHYRTISVQR